MSAQLTHASLFTGRGGFEAAAESLGIPTIWNCELDPWLRGKLKRLYPETKQYTNVKYVKQPQSPSILSAGFPCQDISISKYKAAGIKGSKSGLWFETARVIKECEPMYVLLENSPELLKRGFEYVLHELSELGYYVEWNCLRAQDFGYPHRRKRVYIIAYTNRLGWRGSIFQPLGAIKLLRNWETSEETYIRVSTERANQFRNITAIQKGNVVPNFRREIKAYGNAVMPVIAEYLLRCVQIHYTAF